MRLWSLPFKHIDIPDTTHVRSIEYSFLNNITPMNNEETKAQLTEEDMPVDAIVAKLKSDVLQSKRSLTRYQRNDVPVDTPISTTYFLDYSIAANKHSGQESLFNAKDIAQQLRLIVKSILALNGGQGSHANIQQIQILSDYLIELIEKSRQKINALDAILRKLVLGTASSDANLSSPDSDEEKTPVIMAYQLVSYIDREEKLVEKYTLLRSKLVEVDRLNEQLLRRLWRYRPKKKFNKFLSK